MEKQKATEMDFCWEINLPRGLNLAIHSDFLMVTDLATLMEILKEMHSAILRVRLKDLWKPKDLVKEMRLAK
jgi:hypothetical protein